MSGFDLRIYSKCNDQEHWTKSGNYTCKVLFKSLLCTILLLSVFLLKLDASINKLSPEISLTYFYQGISARFHRLSILHVFNTYWPTDATEISGNCADSGALQPNRRGVSTQVLSKHKAPLCHCNPNFSINKAEAATLSVIWAPPQRDVIQFVSSLPEKHPGKITHRNRNTECKKHQNILQMCFSIIADHCFLMF